MGLGGKKGRLTPLGKMTRKERTYHQNTFLQFFGCIERQATLRIISCRCQSHISNQQWWKRMQALVPLYPYLYQQLLSDFLITFYYILRSISGSSYISSYIRAIDLIIYGSGRCVERTKKSKKRTKKARDLTTSPIPPGHALFGRPSFFGTWDRVADISISAKAISTHL